MHLHSLVKSKFQTRHLLISQEIFYWTEVTRKNFGDYPISMPSGYPPILRIFCVVMFLTVSGMYQDLHKNTSKYGVWESTSSIDVLQETIFIIYHITVISCYIQLLPKFILYWNPEQPIFIHRAHICHLLLSSTSGNPKFGTNSYKFTISQVLYSIKGYSPS